MSLRIIPFEPRLARHFKDLNVAWLQHYFFVEAKDEILLENCENSIIGIGGYIFFAEFKHSIAGCFSLIPIKEKQFELGKMAVDPEFQGLKIGQRLLEFAIEFSKEKQWEKIILYTSTKLPTALHVYRKYGFNEIALEKDVPYKRSDVKMELVL